MIAIYEQLARWSEEVVSSRQWNRKVDQLHALVENLLGTEHGLRELQRVAAEHPNEEVRGYASSDVNPPAPTSTEEMSKWLSHPIWQLAKAASMAAPCTYYLALSTSGGEGAEENFSYMGTGSWVRGRPARVGRWPERVDGAPLRFVGHFDVRYVHDRAALPNLEGAIEVFHDLESTGFDAADMGRGGWHVRFAPYTTEWMPPPENLEGQPAVWLHETDGVSLPHPDDLPHLTGDERERLEEARNVILDAAASTVEPPAADAARDASGRFVPQLLGLPWLGTGHLPANMPTGEVDKASEAGAAEPDGWRLLLDVPGVGPLDGWFGDGGRLEVWAPRDALAAGEYDRCRTILRRQQRH